jgi:hypothetical protein
MLKGLGGALLATGLLGGGFEVMAAKLPALTSLNRMIVGIGGVLLLATGICWHPVPPNNPATIDQDTSQTSNADRDTSQDQ